MQRYTDRETDRCIEQKEKYRPKKIYRKNIRNRGRQTDEKKSNKEIKRMTDRWIDRQKHTADRQTKIERDKETDRQAEICRQ